ncbi:hypothetical protein AMTR_s00002p00144970 [Amborella trichopoda]|uniref:Uncharacterized protein n=1 Tax=Amborella trichopoda TaxID=13333 RepID=W1P0E5_AMBTC|nr:hypothetical protein AMTR_s00002p00144970 [Amborella trichopoda]
MPLIQQDGPHSRNERHVFALCGIPGRHGYYCPLQTKRHVFVAYQGTMATRYASYTWVLIPWVRVTKPSEPKDLHHYLCQN